VIETGRMSVGLPSPDFGFSTSDKAGFPRVFYGAVFLTDSPRHCHPKSRRIQAYYLLFFNSLFEFWKAARRAAKRPYITAVSQPI